MHLVICDSKNLHFINKIKLDKNKYKLLIFGCRNSEYYKVCKNVSFINEVSKIKKFLNKVSYVTIIDHIAFLDPKCFFKKHRGSFFASNLFGDDELYLMQVMGFAPDELNGVWHDEYINHSNLSNSNIKYEFLERFLYEKDKTKFFFNKYKSIQSRDILFTNSTSKLRNSIKKSKTIRDIILNFKNEFNPFLSSEFWYLNYSEENHDYSNRLYKYFKH